MELNFSPIILLAALVLDVIIGDPFYSIHPIVWLGKFIKLLEKVLRKFKLSGIFGGFLLWFFACSISLSLIIALSILLGSIDPILAIIFHFYWLYSLLALGDLAKHCFKIYKAAKSKNLVQVRDWISRLVGRDTDKMDETDCVRAAVESGSENFNDGVIAPIFWYALFGLPGLIIFKVTSTLDSMVGYRNEKYEKFGKVSARLDDLLCFLPARLTVILYALTLIFVNPKKILRGLSAVKNFAKLYPGFNSGWPEAMAGGFLGIKLIGPIYKNGHLVNETFIGFENDRIEALPNDLLRLIIINYIATFFMIFFCILVWFFLR